MITIRNLSAFKPKQKEVEYVLEFIGSKPHLIGRNIGSNGLTTPLNGPIS